MNRLQSKFVKTTSAWLRHHVVAMNDKYQGTFADFKYEDYINEKVKLFRFHNEHAVAPLPEESICHSIIAGLPDEFATMCSVMDVNSTEFDLQVVTQTIAVTDANLRRTLSSPMDLL